MDAVAYFKAYARMCDSFDSKNNFTGKPCVGCPLDDIGRGCHMIDLANNAEECVAAVEKWAKEHQARTRQSELLKLFPEVISDPDGFIDIAQLLSFPQKEKRKRAAVDIRQLAVKNANVNSGWLKSRMVRPDG